MGVCRDLAISGLAAARAAGGTQQFVPALSTGCAVQPTVVLYRWGCLSLHSRRPLMVDLAPLASLRAGLFRLPPALRATNHAARR
jgi:hypothetical protein